MRAEDERERVTDRHTESNCDREQVISSKEKHGVENVFKCYTKFVFRGNQNITPPEH